MEFRGFATDNPEAAIAIYIERTGFEPTALVVRPNSHLINPSDLIFETRFGAAGIILITHEWTVDELRNYYAEIDMPKETTIPRTVASHSLPRVKQATRKRGRPKSRGARCPHCQQLIHNFENLGYWYGWDIGKQPPYWNDLSAYVFDRDEFICQRCGKKRQKSKLVAHHIVPKEKGGIDGARNLSTLCKDSCHEIVHNETVP